MTTPSTSGVAFERVVLEKVKLGSTARIPRNLLNTATVQECQDYLGRELVYGLESTYLQLKDRDDKVTEWTERPKDWWQSCKNRWFPGWLLRRYPVQWEQIAITTANYTRICPHLDAERPGTHLHFMHTTPPGINEYLRKERLVRSYELFEAGYRAGAEFKSPREAYRKAMETI